MYFGVQSFSFGRMFPKRAALSTPKYPKIPDSTLRRIQRSPILDSDKIFEV